MTTGLVSRADLLRVLARSSPAAHDEQATLLGYRRRIEKNEENRQKLHDAVVAKAQPATAQPEYSIELANLRSAQFWTPVAFVQRPERKQRQRPSALPIWRNRPDKPPKHLLLAPWRQLQLLLSSALRLPRRGNNIDIDAAVGLLSRGEFVINLPEARHRAYSSSIDVILDRCDRLTPFWQDQDILSGALHALAPGAQIRLALIDESLTEPQLPDATSYVPPSGGVVLALSDLGCLDPAAETYGAIWHGLAEQIRKAGASPATLLLAPPSRCAKSLLDAWRAVPWETPGAGLPEQDPLSRAKRVENLLSLFAGVVRIEPGLVRAMRRLLPATEADIGTEADFWQHPALTSRHCVAATPDAKRLARYASLTQGKELWAQALRLRAEWRQHLGDDIWFLELLGLPEEAWATEEARQDFADACAFFEGLPSGKLFPSGRIAWFLENCARRASPRAWAVPAFVAAVGQQALRSPGFIPPPAVDPIDVPGGDEPRLLAICQHGEEMLVSEAGNTKSAGSPLGYLRSSNGLFHVEPAEQAAKPGPGPHEPKITWADDWGSDDHGIWASLSVPRPNQPPISYRMRWIAPGEFLMGSPANESGRWEDEGPQHRVTMSQGYWLGETPCTEELWFAVMGRRAGGFGDRFPVTEVSWTEAQEFCARFNRRHPGVLLALPSEAQWEFACRAGTSTPYAFGDRVTKKQVRFDTSWPVPAGTLPANRWGLREMHGNVWEWCEDTWQGSYEGAPTDGSAWIDKGAATRVIRGGSWDDDARLVRAAYRSLGAPSYRLGNLGFRCARVQGESAAGGAGLLRANVPNPVVIPKSGRIIVRSDREELHLRRLTKPDWASAIGRDSFGLFTEITIPDTEITQRMRWIPPGRFWMGSSDDEPGRFDDERPRHEVTLQDGFWLFDTPCTQAWWQVVMDGKNPSRFQTPDRPVERVSFDDVQEFLSRLNKRAPGLNLGLPSEAQWEYACRAGTETTTYAGALAILGENNAPALDPIAWYGGNSGVGFELDDGHDASGWPNKQYDHAKAGTHPIGLKLPNPWGLHDMLGNVFEWCADVWHDSYEGAPTDGSARTGEGAALRVIRGGSWYGNARDVRAAFRAHYDPSYRFDSLGFRCARVQASVRASAERRAGRSKQGERSEPAATTGPKRRDGGGTRVKSAPTRS